MDKREISIATMTWARNAVEERLLRDSLTHLASLDMPAFLTDAGSGKAFLEFLRSFPHFTVYEAPEAGLWPQIRQSILSAEATAGRFILYTEPDKRDFFRFRLAEFLLNAPDDEATGIVLAARSAASFLTFPKFQRLTETAINGCCAEVTQTPADFTYGPFLFNRRLAPHLLSVRKNLGWGWRPYVFGLAHKLGYRTEALVQDLPCPPDQREDDEKERRYRMRQLSESIQGLLGSTTFSARV